MAQPPAKRLRMTVSVGGGERAAAAAGMPASPGSRKLRQTLFAVLFLVRMSSKSTETPSFSQMSRMVKRHVDQAFQKCHDSISSKLEGFQQQIEVLHHEVKRLARLCSNRQIDQRLEKNHEHATANESNTGYRLRFLNHLKTPVYTEKNITAENDAAIKIGIFKGDTMIATGPLSKLKVEVLALRGDFSDDGRESWTEEIFSNHIVQGRDGHGFVLGGDCTVWLTNGEASLRRLRFKEGSSRTRSRMFIIGARVCESEKIGVRVQEAVMKPVTVRDRRNEANEKRHPPKLEDEVYRLDEISKDGKYHKRLRKAHIYTVQAFLKALEDENKLREVLQINKQHSSWKKMVKHARECCLEDRHELQAHHTERGNMATVDKLHDQLDGFSSDHMVEGGFTVPNYANANNSAGPSFVTPSASQTDHSAHHPAHQVSGIEAVGCLSHALFCANLNNDPCSSIPDHHNIQSYQGNPPYGHEQILWPTEVQGYFEAEDADIAPFLNQLPPGIDQELKRQHFSQSNDIIEATTLTRIDMTLSAQQLPFGGAPSVGPAQASMQSQWQAPLPRNGPSEASASTPAQNQGDLAPQQLFQCHGGMPWEAGSGTGYPDD